MNTYSNGWGHLIVTMAVVAMGTTLFLTKAVDPAVTASLMAPVISFWFMSGAASKFATPVTPVMPVLPTATVGGGTPGASGIQ